MRVAVDTRGRGFYDITRLASDAARASGVSDGMCNVFVEHTSASLVFCENADRDVQRDLERFVSRLVPDGADHWTHTAEGPDDMPAHVRSVLTLASTTIPVTDGRLLLGTWQGLYLWEHRVDPHRRWLTVSVWD
ncbi:MAG: YjbQ family protein [Deltaproteobacteria bacterium]|nr:YjbQ family protein [Deltaproteobacteria bacterium]